MIKRVTLSAALLLACAAPAHAHRLDEYLQATMISVGKERVRAQIRLTPGVAVSSSILAEIDANADGVLSDAEQLAYAQRVLRELSLGIDGTLLPLRLVSSKYASIAEMKEGRGDIVIDFDAVVPSGDVDRHLTFENRHQRAISVYLVNALVSRDPDVRVVSQKRNYEQSSYQLDYEQAGTRSLTTSLARWLTSWGWLAIVGVFSVAQLARLARRQERTLADTVNTL